jgi:putative toxin-antitoxin system antitoxin component (TIGR02293 family)
MKASILKAPPKRSPVAKRVKAAGKNGARTPHQLVKVVQAGLKFDELEALRAGLGLPLEKLAEKLGIARATLHRRKIGGRLAPDESDKVIRFARLLRSAEQIFGGREGARQWLSFPQYGLGGAVPLDYARTEVGAREVETLLGRIEYGVYS